MKAKTTVSLRTVQRIKADHRKAIAQYEEEARRARGELAQARGAISNVEMRLREMAQYAVSQERIVNIISIVEEIAEFHRLSPEVSAELMGALHRGIAPRKVRVFLESGRRAV